MRQLTELIESECAEALRRFALLCPHLEQGVALPELARPLSARVDGRNFSLLPMTHTDFGVVRETFSFSKSTLYPHDFSRS